MRGELPAAVVDDFVIRLGHGDEEGCRALVSELVASGGQGVRAVADDLIPRALELVGEKWEAAEWNVAQEHVASDICERIVATMTMELTAPAESTSAAVIACAEGEWHSLAAHIAAMGLQLRSWRPVVLGPSVSASQLVAAIYDAGPELVAVSCSLPANLPGARRMIVTALETGTPVVAGGRAFGESPDVAKRLGASSWAASAFDLADLAEGLDTFVPPLAYLDQALHPDLGILEAHESTIVQELSELLGVEHTVDGELGAGGVWLFRTLQAALMCDDRKLLERQLQWQQGRSRLAGALPAAVIARALLAAIPRSAATARAWLDTAASDAGVEL